VGDGKDGDIVTVVIDGINVYVHMTVRMLSLAEPEVVDILQCHQHSSAQRSSIEKPEVGFAEVDACARERSHVVRASGLMIGIVVDPLPHVIDILRHRNV